MGTTRLVYSPGKVKGHFQLSQFVMTPQMPLVFHTQPRCWWHISRWLVLKETQGCGVCTAFWRFLHLQPHRGPLFFQLILATHLSGFFWCKPRFLGSKKSTSLCLQLPSLEPSTWLVITLFQNISCVFCLSSANLTFQATSGSSCLGHSTLHPYFQ